MVSICLKGSLVDTKQYFGLLKVIAIHLTLMLCACHQNILGRETIKVQTKGNRQGIHLGKIHLTSGKLWQSSGKRKSGKFRKSRQLIQKKQTIQHNTPLNSLSGVS